MIQDNSQGEPETPDEDPIEQDESEEGLSDEEILQQAKERFNLAVDAEAETRREELDDLKFMIGEQWPLDIKNARLTDKRPCLTINRIPQFVRQITNDFRVNRPSIKINPCDNLGDVDTAKILQGIIRHIEYKSHSDIAYDTAQEASAKNGLGYWRLVTEYSDPMSFQQEICIKRIKDRFSVYLDPYYQEPDGSDAMWGFVFEDMAKDEYKAQFPNTELSSMAEWESLGNTLNDWIKRDVVRVAEYYYKTFERTKIVQLSNKKVVEKKDLPSQLPDGVRVISERDTVVPRIKWCKINGLEILERTEIFGSWVPIIPVIGEEEIVDGRRIISGIIRHAKDPQRMLNYWKSCETETIALAPRTPFIGAEGQFEGYEEDWKTANSKNHAFLQYKAETVGGQPLPPPQRQSFEPAVQAITQAAMQSGEDLKSTTGIYDASLGNRSNEQSGLAIQRRSAQSQTSNFHFIDNFSRSLRHTGRILINWIPKVYDGPQVIRIIGEDGEVKMQAINGVVKQNGEDKAVFLDHGDYDCTVDTGPSFQTRRQEAVAGQLDLLRTAPQLMQIAGDILVRNMDWPGSQEIADRLKKTIPPNLIDDKNQAEIPPQLKAQMAQMGQMVQQQADQLDEAYRIISTKKLELESKERIEVLKMQNDLQIEVMKHDAKDAQIAFASELDILHKRLNKLNFDQPIGEGIGGNAGTPNPQMNPQQQQPIGGQPAGMGQPQ